MRLIFGLLWVFAVWILPVVACSEVTTPSAAPITITVGTGPPLIDRVPLEGVRVCELDNASNCAMTDTRGEATLVLPLEQETGYTLDKEGYASWLAPTIIQANQTALGMNMATAQGIADGHARVMSPYPMRGTGTVAVQLFPPFAGAMFELVAATGTAFYMDMDEDYSWSSDLTETTFMGIGGFTELTPGEVQVNIGGTADKCTPTGWPSGEADRVRAPVREGYVTLSGVSCPVPR